MELNTVNPSTLLQSSACSSQERSDGGGSGAAGERSQCVGSGRKRSAFSSLFKRAIFASNKHTSEPKYGQTFSFSLLLPLGYTPALACAPNRDVADCLALILNSMMPTSPMVTIAALPALSLTRTVINHHPSSNHISKGVAFDTPPPLRPDHASYCRPDRPLSSVSADDEIIDSDSETY